MRRKMGRAVDLQSRGHVQDFDAKKPPGTKNMEDFFAYLENHNEQKDRLKQEYAAAKKEEPQQEPVIGKPTQQIFTLKRGSEQVKPIQQRKKFSGLSPKAFFEDKSHSKYKFEFNPHAQLSSRKTDSQKA